MQMRDEVYQLNPVLFRRNLHRFAAILGYEISKTLNYESVKTVTPLGEADCNRLADQVVLATIIRAGLPMHEGLLSVFDKAESAFISAYRQHHKDGTFEVSLEYISSPIAAKVGSLSIESRLPLDSEPTKLAYNNHNVT